MKKAIPVIIAVVLIFVIIAITFGMKVVDRFSYSEERMDLNEYFSLAADDEAALVLNNEIREEKGAGEGRQVLSVSGKRCTLI